MFLHKVQYLSSGGSKSKKFDDSYYFSSNSLKSKEQVRFRYTSRYDRKKKGGRAPSILLQFPFYTYSM